MLMMQPFGFMYALTLGKAGTSGEHSLEHQRCLAGHALPALSNCGYQRVAPRPTTPQLASYGEPAPQCHLACQDMVDICLHADEDIQQRTFSFLLTHSSWRLSRALSECTKRSARTVLLPHAAQLPACIFKVIISFCECFCPFVLPRIAW